MSPMLRLGSSCKELQLRLERSHSLKVISGCDLKIVGNKRMLQKVTCTVIYIPQDID